jgi:hypothetical protein
MGGFHQIGDSIVRADEIPVKNFRLGPSAVIQHVHNMASGKPKALEHHDARTPVVVLFGAAFLIGLCAVLGATAMIHDAIDLIERRLNYPDRETIAIERGDMVLVAPVAFLLRFLGRWGGVLAACGWLGWGGCGGGDQGLYGLL